MFMKKIFKKIFAVDSSGLGSYVELLSCILFFSVENLPNLIHLIKKAIECKCTNVIEYKMHMLLNFSMMIG